MIGDRFNMRNRFNQTRVLIETNAILEAAISKMLWVRSYIGEDHRKESTELVEKMITFLDGPLDDAIKKVSEEFYLDQIKLENEAILRER